MIFKGATGQRCPGVPALLRISNFHLNFHCGHELSSIFEVGGVHGPRLPTRQPETVRSDLWARACTVPEPEILPQISLFVFLWRTTHKIREKTKKKSFFTIIFTQEWMKQNWERNRRKETKNFLFFFFHFMFFRKKKN